MQTHPKTYGCNINAYTHNDNSTTSILIMMCLYCRWFWNQSRDIRNVYTFVIKIDYVLRRCFFFFFLIFCRKSSAFMWLRGRTWVSTPRRWTKKKKTHFLHFPMLLYSSLLLSTFLSGVLIMKASSLRCKNWSQRFCLLLNLTCYNKINKNHRTQ